jgi:iron-sulfur cluster insertion protein
MIKISDTAKEKIIDVLVHERTRHLRFGLQGGGCSGFQYYFSTTDNTPSDDDLLIDLGNDFFLIVDSISMMYLDNAEIDYKKDLMGETFVFNNPNTKTSCGCGNSIGF